MQNYSLGKKLLAVRKARKMSRADVAMAFYDAGRRVSGETIKNWESGVSEPRMSDIEIFSKVFGKTAGFFFNQNDTKQER